MMKASKGGKQWSPSHWSHHIIDPGVWGSVKIGKLHFEKNVSNYTLNYIGKNLVTHVLEYVTALRLLTGIKN